MKLNVELPLIATYVAYISPNITRAFYKVEMHKMYSIR